MDSFLYMKKSITTIWVVTLYLMVYSVIGHLGASLNTMLLLFSFSPVLVIYMVFTVLQANVEVKEFSSNEEWGYSDKSFS